MKAKFVGLLVLAFAWNSVEAVAQTAPVFKSVRDVLATIPANLLPPMNADFWNELQLQRANEWLASNVAGKKCQLIVRFGSPSRSERGSKKVLSANFLIESGEVVNNLKLKMINAGGSFSPDQEDKLASMKNGEHCMVAGTIDHVLLSGVAGKSNPKNAPPDRTIHTRVSFSLKDCIVSAPPPGTFIPPRRLK
jgi:hypothetical protein